VAIDTEVQKSNVTLGDKCCGINGRDIVLTSETLISGGVRESQGRLPAAVVVVKKLL